MAILVDGYGRRIDYLRISITDRCNLRCIYCLPAEGVRPVIPTEILTYEEILQVVRLLVGWGVNKVRLTGGEPLLRRDVTYLIRGLASIEGLGDLSLSTNGTRLAEMASDLAQAGLRRVNISLDSLDPQKYAEITRGSQIERVWEGTEAAVRAGLNPVKINTVIIRGLNDDEVLDFARLTLDRPLHVRFIEHMPIGARGIWEEHKVVSAAEIKAKVATLGSLIPVNEVLGEGPARYFRLPGAYGTLGFISPLSDHFCDSCNRIRLTADGRLRPCLFSESELDLKGLLRSGRPEEEIARFLKDALERKPKGHGICQRPPYKVSRPMTQIGG